MSLIKTYLKTKPVCKVKFVAPKQLIEQSRSICVAGEFNDWDVMETKLRRQKNGDYATTVNLETGNEYEFRYVLDGKIWENDFDADKYVPSRICEEENSVVVV